MKFKQGDQVRWTNLDTNTEALAASNGIIVGPLDTHKFDLAEVGQMYTVALPGGIDIHAFEDELTELD